MDRQILKLEFVIAVITNPLLGFDFLETFGLTINCSNRTIYDPLTATTKDLKLTITSPVNLMINEVELSSFIRTTLNKYPEIISPHKIPGKILRSLPQNRKRKPLAGFCEIQAAVERNGKSGI